MQLAPMRSRDRASLRELLAATGAFSADETEVALQLFDHSRGGADDAPVASVDYEFVGAYDDEHDDELLGYACFGPTPATEGTWDLYWLAVHPSSQGRGTGRALVREVERQLAARGARLLVVETSSRADYSRTRDFYARAGYAESARVRDFYAPADDRIILTTRLTAPAGGAATR